MPISWKLSLQKQTDRLTYLGLWVVAVAHYLHICCVMPLQWLPGLEINGKGKVSRAADGAQECNFFATTAGDGKVWMGSVSVSVFEYSRLGPSFLALGPMLH